MTEKKTKEEKLSDFERKDNHWRELMRNWIIETSQAGNLIKQENLSGMKDFLVDTSANHRLAAGRLEIDFKKSFNLLPNLRRNEGRSPEATSLTNLIWWCLLEKVRTHFERNPD